MAVILDASADSAAARDALINEYVAVGGYGDADNILSQRLDDITDHFGPEIYDRMLLDPEISARMELIKIATLGDGLTVSPRVRANDTNFDRASEIRDFLAFNFTRRGVNFRQFAYEMLDALPYGNKVAEVTYEVMEAGRWRDKTVIKSIKVKPRGAVAFVVNQFLDTRGFLAFRNSQVFMRGMPLMPLMGTIGGTGVGSVTGYTPDAFAGPVTNDPNGPRILPRIKFAVLTFRGKDNDPRGNSILRPCYNSWNFKQKMYPEWMLFLCNAAQPSVIGIAPPEGAIPMPPKANEPTIDDTTGKQATDDAGKPKFQTAVQRLGAVLAKLRKVYAAAVPNGTTFEVLETKHDGSSYIKSIDACDRAITTAMCLATLGVREGQYMSRNAGSLHAGVIDLFIYFVKQLFLDMVVNDLSTVLLDLNYNEDAHDLMPVHSLGDTERRDWAKEAAAAAQLLNTGTLPVRIIQDIFIQLGFEELDATELAEIVQARLAESNPNPDPNADPAKQPAGGGGPKRLPAKAAA